MGIYYTMKCSTLLEKVGISRKYMAIEVRPHDQALVFLNTNTSVAVDDITKISWEPNLKLKMVLSPRDKVCVKFEGASDLRAFLGDLNLDIPVLCDTGGGICAGSYTPRTMTGVRPTERASELLGTIMENMRTHSKRRNSKSYTFDRGAFSAATTRGSLEFRGPTAGSAGTY
ncbi:hypothetical protein H310_10273 [Aphanomyces invadans]|uniref:Uncharacterized protein n=1 Tax=Aphanomyces invadans TaxID=157072 RepID=A0A024TQY6_9STRA|nr:hypothetical protein H310_10273 [Aphanomyces invadans]ETV96570.1 hypothetical protein H310_10273 [Aphanomyces invadans]|eukprot:XP_008874833.1 hypothetical protein H310_10273 [Aphanomyces invadans]